MLGLAALGRVHHASIVGAFGIHGRSPFLSVILVLVFWFSAGDIAGVSLGPSETTGL
jgi:hypothetical protein